VVALLFGWKTSIWEALGHKDVQCLATSWIFEKTSLSHDFEAKQNIVMPVARIAQLEKIVSNHRSIALT
jgi:hypothetical protein